MQYIPNRAPSILPKSFRKIPAHFPGLDPKSEQVLIKLISLANFRNDLAPREVAPGKFMQLNRGEVAISREDLARATARSVKEVRAACSRLERQAFLRKIKKEAEPGARSRAKYPDVYFIVNFDSYDGKKEAGAECRAECRAKCGPSVGQVSAASPRELTVSWPGERGEQGEQKDGRTSDFSSAIVSGEGENEEAGTVKGDEAVRALHKLRPDIPHDKIVCKIKRLEREGHSAGEVLAWVRTSGEQYKNAENPLGYLGKCISCGAGRQALESVRAEQEQEAGRRARKAEQEKEGIAEAKRREELQSQGPRRVADILNSVKNLSGFGRQFVERETER